MHIAHIVPFNIFKFNSCKNGKKRQMAGKVIIISFDGDGENGMFSCIYFV